MKDNRLPIPNISMSNEYSEQILVTKRQEAAARMLLDSDFPENVKTQMNLAFSKGEYNKVQNIAAEYDIKKRESLDHKITMYPNPNFKKEINIEEVNKEIKDEFLNALAKLSLQRLEYGEEIQLKNKELESVEPYEINDPNPRFLFKAKGIDEEFDSAYKAIRAYKKKHNIPIPEIGKHSFRKTLVYLEDEDSTC